MIDEQLRYRTFCLIRLARAIRQLNVAQMLVGAPGISAQLRKLAQLSILSLLEDCRAAGCADQARELVSGTKPEPRCQMCPDRAGCKGEGRCGR